MSSTECYNCKASNPEGKKYCGDCGAYLDASVGPLKDFLESTVNQQIEATLKEKFKDAKVVEVECAEAIVVKLQGWAKLLGYFVGIPIFILVSVLGIFGIKTYSDFTTLVRSTGEGITQNLHQAELQAELIQEEANRLTSEYQKLEAQLAEINTLAKEVGALETRVDRIEEYIIFEPSTALTPDLQREIESYIPTYQEYLQVLGYKPERAITVYVDPNLEGNAYFDGERIVVGSSLASDEDVVLREYSHFILSSAVESSLGTLNLGQGPMGSIASALADYFPSSFSNDSRLGETIAPYLLGKPYVRNLDNNRSFNEISSRTTVQDAGEIWGGAFWEIRQLIGQAAADKLLFTTWLSLEPSDLNDDLAGNFVRLLLEIDQELEGGNYTSQIRSVFERRGLSF